MDTNNVGGQNPTNNQNNNLPPVEKTIDVPSSPPSPVNPTANVNPQSNDLSQVAKQAQDLINSINKPEPKTSPLPPPIPTPTPSQNTNPIPTVVSPLTTEAPKVNSMPAYKQSNTEPLPTKPNNSKKALSYAGLAVLMFMLSAVTFGVLNLLNPNSSKNQASTATTAKTILGFFSKPVKTGAGEKSNVVAWKQPQTYLQNPISEKDSVATEVLNWLNEQRDERGVYVGNYQCVDNQSCAKKQADNRAGIVAIWARFLSYNKSNNAQDLEILKKDLGLFSNLEIIRVLQNSFWNCRLMYELWSSNLNSDLKNKAKNICEMGQYLPVDKTLAKNYDLNEVINQKGSANPDAEKLSEEGTNLTQYSAYASDFATKYAWNKKEADLKTAKDYFNQALSYWLKDNKESYLSGKCVLGIAALDIAKYGNLTDYLEFAKKLFDKENLQGLIASNNNLDSYFYRSLPEQTTCGIFVNNLGKQTNNTQYSKLKDSVVSYLITNLFLYPEYEKDQKGFGSFYSKNIVNDSLIINKSVKDNSMAVSLLLE